MKYQQQPENKTINSSVFVLIECLVTNGRVKHIRDCGFNNIKELAWSSMPETPLRNASYFVVKLK